METAFSHDTSSTATNQDLFPEERRAAGNDAGLLHTVKHVTAPATSDTVEDDLLNSNEASETPLDKDNNPATLRSNAFSSGFDEASFTSGAFEDHSHGSHQLGKLDEFNLREDAKRTENKDGHSFVLSSDRESKDERSHEQEVFERVSHGELDLFGHEVEWGKAFSGGISDVSTVLLDDLHESPESLGPGFSSFDAAKNLNAQPIKDLGAADGVQDLGQAELMREGAEHVDQAPVLVPASLREDEPDLLNDISGSHSGVLEPSEVTTKPALSDTGHDGLYSFSTPVLGSATHGNPQTDDVDTSDVVDRRVTKQEPSQDKTAPDELKTTDVVKDSGSNFGENTVKENERARSHKQNGGPKSYRDMFYAPAGDMPDASFGGSDDTAGTDLRPTDEKRADASDAVLHENLDDAESGDVFLHARSDGAEAPASGAQVGLAENVPFPSIREQDEEDQDVSDIDFFQMKFETPQRDDAIAFDAVNEMFRAPGAGIAVAAHSNLTELSEDELPHQPADTAAATLLSSVGEVEGHSATVLQEQPLGPSSTLADHEVQHADASDEFGNELFSVPSQKEPLGPNDESDDAADTNTHQPADEQDTKPSQSPDQINDGYNVPSQEKDKAETEMMKHRTNSIGQEGEVLPTAGGPQATEMTDPEAQGIVKDVTSSPDHSAASLDSNTLEPATTIVTLSDENPTETADASLPGRGQTGQDRATPGRDPADVDIITLSDREQAGAVGTSPSDGGENFVKDVIDSNGGDASEDDVTYLNGRESDVEVSFLPVAEQTTSEGATYPDRSTALSGETQSSVLNASANVNAVGLESGELQKVERPFDVQDAKLQEQMGPPAVESPWSDGKLADNDLSYEPDNDSRPASSSADRGDDTNGVHLDQTGKSKEDDPGSEVHFTNLGDTATQGHVVCSDNGSVLLEQEHVADEIGTTAIKLLKESSLDLPSHGQSGDAHDEKSSADMLASKEEPSQHVKWTLEEDESVLLDVSSHGENNHHLLGVQGNDADETPPAKDVTEPSNAQPRVHDGTTDVTSLQLQGLESRPDGEGSQPHLKPDDVGETEVPGPFGELKTEVHHDKEEANVEHGVISDDMKSRTDLHTAEGDRTDGAGLHENFDKPTSSLSEGIAEVSTGLAVSDGEHDDQLHELERELTDDQNTEMLQLEGELSDVHVATDKHLDDSQDHSPQVGNEPTKEEIIASFKGANEEQASSFLEEREKTDVDISDPSIRKQGGDSKEEWRTMDKQHVFGEEEDSAEQAEGSTSALQTSNTELHLHGGRYADENEAVLSGGVNVELWSQDDRGYVGDPATFEHENKLKIDTVNAGHDDVPGRASQKRLDETEDDLLGFHAQQTSADDTILRGQDPVPSPDMPVSKEQQKEEETAEKGDPNNGVISPDTELCGEKDPLKDELEDEVHVDFSESEGLSVTDTNLLPRDHLQNSNVQPYGDNEADIILAADAALDEQNLPGDTSLQKVAMSSSNDRDSTSKLVHLSEDFSGENGDQTTRESLGEPEVYRSVEKDVVSDPMALGDQDNSINEMFSVATETADKKRDEVTTTTALVDVELADAEAAMLLGHVDAARADLRNDKLNDDDDLSDRAVAGSSANQVDVGHTAVDTSGLRELEDELLTGSLAHFQGGGYSVADTSDLHELEAEQLIGSNQSDKEHDASVDAVSVEAARKEENGKTIPEGKYAIESAQFFGALENDLQNQLPKSDGQNLEQGSGSLSQEDQEEPRTGLAVAHEEKIHSDEALPLKKGVDSTQTSPLSNTDEAETGKDASQHESEDDSKTELHSSYEERININTKASAEHDLISVETSPTPSGEHTGFDAGSSPQTCGDVRGMGNFDGILTEQTDAEVASHHVTVSDLQSRHHQTAGAGASMSAEDESSSELVANEDRRDVGEKILQQAVSEADTEPPKPDEGREDVCEAHSMEHPDQLSYDQSQSHVLPLEDKDAVTHNTTHLSRKDVPRSNGQKASGETEVPPVDKSKPNDGLHLFSEDLTDMDGALSSEVRDEGQALFPPGRNFASASGLTQHHQTGDLNHDHLFDDQTFDVEAARPNDDEPRLRSDLLRATGNLDSQENDRDSQKRDYETKSEALLVSDELPGHAREIPHERENKSKPDLAGSNATLLSANNDVTYNDACESKSQLSAFNGERENVDECRISPEQSGDPQGEIQLENGLRADGALSQEKEKRMGTGQSLSVNGSTNLGASAEHVDKLKSNTAWFDVKDASGNESISEKDHPSAAWVDVSGSDDQLRDVHDLHEISEAPDSGQSQMDGQSAFEDVSTLIELGNKPDSDFDRAIHGDFGTAASEEIGETSKTEQAQFVDSHPQEEGTIVHDAEDDSKCDLPESDREQLSKDQNTKLLESVQNLESEPSVFDGPKNAPDGGDDDIPFTRGIESVEKPPPSDWQHANMDHHPKGEIQEDDLKTDVTDVSDIEQPDYDAGFSPQDDSTFEDLMYDENQEEAVGTHETESEFELIQSHSDGLLSDVKDAVFRDEAEHLKAEAPLLSEHVADVEAAPPQEHRERPWLDGGNDSKHDVSLPELTDRVEVMAKGQEKVEIGLRQSNGDDITGNDVIQHGVIDELTSDVLLDVESVSSFEGLLENENAEAPMTDPVLAAGLDNLSAQNAANLQRQVSEPEEKLGASHEKQYDVDGLVSRERDGTSFNQAWFDETPVEKSKTFTHQPANEPKKEHLECNADDVDDASRELESNAELHPTNEERADAEGPNAPAEVTTPKTAPPGSETELVVVDVGRGDTDLAPPDSLNEQTVNLDETVLEEEDVDDRIPQERREEACSAGIAPQESSEDSHVGAKVPQENNEVWNVDIETPREYGQETAVDIKVPQEYSGRADLDDIMSQIFKRETAEDENARQERRRDTDMGSDALQERREYGSVDVTGLQETMEKTKSDNTTPQAKENMANVDTTAPQDHTLEENVHSSELQEHREETKLNIIESRDHIQEAQVDQTVLQEIEEGSAKRTADLESPPIPVRSDMAEVEVPWSDHDYTSEDDNKNSRLALSEGHLFGQITPFQNIAMPENDQHRSESKQPCEEEQASSTNTRKPKPLPRSQGVPTDVDSGTMSQEHAYVSQTAPSPPNVDGTNWKNAISAVEPSELQEATAELCESEQRHHAEDKPPSLSEAKLGDTTPQAKEEETDVDIVVPQNHTLEENVRGSEPQEHREGTKLDVIESQEHKQDAYADQTVSQGIEEDSEKWTADLESPPIPERPDMAEVEMPWSDHDYTSEDDNKNSRSAFSEGHLSGNVPQFQNIDMPESDQHTISGGESSELPETTAELCESEQRHHAEDKPPALPSPHRQNGAETHHPQLDATKGVREVDILDDSRGQQEATPLHSATGTDLPEQDPPRSEGNRVDIPLRAEHNDEERLTSGVNSKDEIPSARPEKKETMVADSGKVRDNQEGHQGQAEERHSGSTAECDDSCEGTAWHSCIVGGQEHVIDMKVIEPYRKVLSHGGYTDGRDEQAIIVFASCYLPNRSRTDYNYVMDNLFLYVLATLDELVADDYVLIYLHGATESSRSPSFSWLRRCYQLIDRRLRKNLQGLYLVHPTFWLRTIVALTRPFISSKFSRKLRYVNGLRELSDLLPMNHVAVPDEVKQHEFKQMIAERKRELHIK